MPQPRPQLGQPARRLRGMVTRGLASAGPGAPLAIEPKGGKFGAGLIRNFAVITRGEALGHNVWIDSHFVDQVQTALSADAERGLKSRFTHPGLSADGMGKLLGRAYGTSRDGDISRADLHLSRSAHRAPDGNLAQYVMDLAADDPTAFGASIVYYYDEHAEEEFSVQHGAVRGAEGLSYSSFRSPDPLNTRHLPHARLQKLAAVDIVDEPAANAGGMFGRDPVFADVEQLALHVAGLTTQPPALRHLDLDPHRVSVFFRGFLNRHGLALKKEPPMPPAAPAPAELTAAQQAKRFLDAYGAQGAVWFAEGKSFEECAKLHVAEQEKQRAAELAKRDEQIKQLTAERDELKQRIAQAKLGEKPLPVNVPEQPAASTKTPFANDDKLAKYAAKLQLAK